MSGISQMRCAIYAVSIALFLLLDAAPASAWCFQRWCSIGNVEPPDPCRNGRCDVIIDDPGPSPEELERQAQQRELERQAAEKQAEMQAIRERHEREERERRERLQQSYDLHGQAIALHGSDNLAGAIELYRQALALNPDNQSIINNLTLAETKLRRRQENEAAFARLQKRIDELSGATKTDLTPTVQKKPCEDTNFFGSCSDQVMAFGDPDRLDARSRRGRGGLDTSGPLWGARTEIPADVEGGPLDPDRRSQDPEMIEAVKELDGILEEQVKIDDSLRQLQRERNRAKDAGKMAELNVQIEQVNAKKQEILVKKVAVIEKKKKLHRSIDTSVKPKEGIAQ